MAVAASDVVDHVLFDGGGRRRRRGPATAGHDQGKDAKKRAAAQREV
jgi:hypothetical protein